MTTKYKNVWYHVKSDCFANLMAWIYEPGLPLYFDLGTIQKSRLWLHDKRACPVSWDPGIVISWSNPLKVIKIPYYTFAALRSQLYTSLIKELDSWLMVAEINLNPLCSIWRECAATAVYHLPPHLLHPKLRCLLFLTGSCNSGTTLFWGCGKWKASFSLLKSAKCLS